MKKIIATLALVAATSAAHAGTITFSGSIDANEAYDCFKVGKYEECEYTGGTYAADADKYIADVRATLKDIASLGYKSVALEKGSTLVIEAAFKGQVYDTDLFAKLFAVRNVYVNKVVFKYGDRIVKNDEAKVFGRSKGFVRYQKLEIYSAGRLSATQKIGG